MFFFFTRQSTKEKKVVFKINFPCPGRLQHFEMFLSSILTEINITLPEYPTQQGEFTYG